MKTKINQMVIFLLILIFSSNVFAQKKILFVGVDEDPDNLLINRIEAIGYIVTFIDATAFGGTTYSNAAGYTQYDALFISESVGSSTVVNYKTAGFPIPCVTTEGWAPRAERWDLLTDNETQFKQLSGDEKTVDGLTLIIQENAHYITQNYLIGEPVPWSSNEAGASSIGPTGFKIGENVPSAIALAKNKSAVLSDFPALWAIPQGVSPLNDPSVMLPRMVILGVIVTDALGEFATDGFYSLITRSLQWVTNDVGSGINNEAIDKYDVKVIPNPATEFVEFSFTLQEKALVRLDIYDMQGRVVKSIPAENYNPGLNEISLDLSPTANAFYIYEFDINNKRFTGKINTVK